MVVASKASRAIAVEALKSTRLELRPGTRLSMAYRRHGGDSMSLEEERLATDRRIKIICSIGDQ